MKPSVKTVEQIVLSDLSVRVRDFERVDIIKHKFIPERFKLNFIGRFQIYRIFLSVYSHRGFSDPVNAAHIDVSGVNRTVSLFRAGYRNPVAGDVRPYRRIDPDLTQICVFVCKAGQHRYKRIVVRHYIVRKSFSDFEQFGGVVVVIVSARIKRIVVCVKNRVRVNIRYVVLFKKRVDLIFHQTQIFIVLHAVSYGFEAKRGYGDVSVYHSVAFNPRVHKKSVARSVIGCKRIIPDISVRAFLCQLN